MDVKQINEETYKKLLDLRSWYECESGNDPGLIVAASPGLDSIAIVCTHPALAELLHALVMRAMEEIASKPN